MTHNLASQAISEIFIYNPHGAERIARRLGNFELADYLRQLNDLAGTDFLMCQLPMSYFEK
jgi:hypothetical protein